MDQLTLLPEDSRASRSASPENAAPKTTLATSGRKCFESYPSASQLGSWVKTCLTSPIWFSEKCVLTWKLRATKSNRLIFRLVPSEPDTSANGRGFLPTLQTVDKKRTARKPRFKQDRITRDPSLPGNYRGDLADWIGGPLFPQWCETWMGYPIGYTESTPSETPSCHKSQPESSER